jgi:hypothetical protein
MRVGSACVHGAQYLNVADELYEPNQAASHAKKKMEA